MPRSLGGAVVETTVDALPARRFAVATHMRMRPIGWRRVGLSADR